VAATSAAPSQARRDATTDTLHGQIVADPYRWLEQAASPATLRWMTAEDAHARRTLSKLPNRAQLERRLKALSYVESMGTPFRRGGRFFFSRRRPDQEKHVWYWYAADKGDPNHARVLLDPNTLSRDGSVSLRGMSFAWNGERVAYKLSQNASDESTLHVMDVGSSTTSQIDRIPGAKYAHASWEPDARGFYYTRLPVDPSIPVDKRPGYAEVYHHRLGTDPASDRLVFSKTGDPRTFVTPQLSRDGSLLFVYVHHGWTRTDVYFKDLAHEEQTFRPLIVGQDADYEVVPYKRNLYVLTNENAPRNRVFIVNPRRLARKNWREIVPQQTDAVLKSVSIMGGRLALSYLHRVTTTLKVATLGGKILRQVALPGLGTASPLVGHPDHDLAYYSFSSFVQPWTIYRTSVARGGREVFFQQALPIDTTPFLVEQVFYPSKDGTKISMFIVRRKDQPKNGNNPYLLYGYGGFNISLTSAFSDERFVWLEAGGSLAIPNLRGGGEYGEAWHRAGMMHNKQNVFDDFIAAAQYLISNKYTKPGQLAIEGGSNGGLLVGAFMTQRPELVRAVVCHVPLLDMVRYHLFGSGRTWIAEYGSAEDPRQFQTLLAYSPYHRVKPGGAYPSLLMLSADSDDRVDPMHARKFVAAVRHASSSARPVLMRIESKAGHGGADMIKKRVARTADVYAFLLDQLQSDVASSGAVSRVPGSAAETSPGNATSPPSTPGAKASDGR
jgi:prolyl oligopeptidase